MLAETGAHGVVLGHSERRELFGETDRALALKLPAALAAGLRPILCVGETEAERAAGDTERKLRQQIREDLAGLADEQLPEVAIAYEPIWAIGTGQTATPEQAQDAVAFIRALVADRVGARGGRARAGPLRRLGQPRERRLRCWRSPMWTGRSSGAPRWRPPRSPQIVQAAGLMEVPQPSSPCRASASSCWTAGASPIPAPATPSRSPARRCSTSCGPPTPTPR